MVTDGKDVVAREMGVWEDLGAAHIRGGIALGSFSIDCAKLFWNTGYAGQGYARITPFNSNRAVIGLYRPDCQEMEIDRFYANFLEEEGLEHLEFIVKYSVPVFSKGRVSKFQVAT